MVRRSVPLSSKCVANECLSAWVVTRLAIPAAAAARRTASPYPSGCKWCRRITPDSGSCDKWSPGNIQNHSHRSPHRDIFRSNAMGKATPGVRLARSWSNNTRAPASASFNNGIRSHESAVPSPASHRPASQPRPSARLRSALPAPRSGSIATTANTSASPRPSAPVASPCAA